MLFRQKISRKWPTCGAKCGQAALEAVLLGCALVSSDSSSLVSDDSCGKTLTHNVQLNSDACVQHIGAQLVTLGHLDCVILLQAVL